MSVSFNLASSFARKNPFAAVAAFLCSDAAAAVSGATKTYDTFEFDDLIDMESALAAQYLIGDDIQGSGLIDGSPQYFLAHAFVQALKPHQASPYK